MNIVDCFISGLTILKPFCEDDVQITEAGNYIFVWNSTKGHIVLPKDKEEEIIKWGWIFSEHDGWGISLSH